ncbi:MAG: cation transporter [Paludibacteraceae bacterium]|nr:cation transporter [Paludibacteraceae bacterium]
MRRILIILLSLLPMIGVMASKPEKPATKETVVLTCDLHCQGCCDKIMKNIAWEKGVKDIVCDLKTKTVAVTYDPRKTDVETLLKAFERIGKPAKVKKA